MFRMSIGSGGKINLNTIVEDIGKLNKQQINQALMQAAAFMVSSLMMGYQNAKDPDGKEWEPLAEWYTHRPMEDGIIRPPKNPVKPKSKPLNNTGHLRKNITFQIAGGTAYVGYGDKVASIIAEKHQNSIAGPMRIDLGNGVFSITVKPKQRKNIGFSVKIPRIGQYNDIETITKIFVDMIEKAIQ